MTGASIGEVIRGLRGNWSQVDVAQAMGVSQPLVSNIERGIRGCKTTTLQRYADVLGWTGEPSTLQLRWDGSELTDKIVPNEEHPQIAQLITDRSAL